MGSKIAILILGLLIVGMLAVYALIINQAFGLFGGSDNDDSGESSISEPGQEFIDSFDDEDEGLSHLSSDHTDDMDTGHHSDSGFHSETTAGIPGDTYDEKMEYLIELNSHYSFNNDYPGMIDTSLRQAALAVDYGMDALTILSPVHAAALLESDIVEIRVQIAIDHLKDLLAHDDVLFVECLHHLMDMYPNQVDEIQAEIDVIP